MASLYFNDLQAIENKCPSCSHKIAYGETTHYDDSEEAHVCNSCEFVLS